MITRMCKVSMMACGVAALVMMGCASSGGPKVGNDEQKPISKVTSADMLDIPEKEGREILPATHFAAGKLHENNGHLVRAVEQYRLAVGADANYIEAYNRLGIVFNRLGRFAEAEETFQKAIKLAPEADYLLNNLAFVYMTQSRWTEAEAELNKALEKNSDFVRAHINLAIVMAQQDRFDEAMIQFRTVLASEDAYYNMGLMYQSKKLLVEAARSFQAALELNPKFVAAQKQLDKLPPDVIEEAAQQTEIFASPLPMNIEEETKSEMTDQATSQPADFEGDIAE